MMKFLKLYIQKIGAYFDFGSHTKIVHAVIALWVIIWFSVFAWLLVSSQSVDLDLMSNTQYPTHGSDSEHYTILSENLLNQHAFSLATQPPFLPDGFRTIGYPLFLASIKTVFQSYHAVIVIQMMLLLTSAYIVYKIAEQLGLEKWSFLPSAVILFDPAAIFYSLFLLSDTIFNFLLILCVWFFLQAIKKTESKKRIFNYSVAGILLGIAILVRPIAIFLPAVFIFTYAVSQSSFSFKNFFTEIGILLGCTVLTISPWVIRNHYVFNTWQISSVGPVTFFEFTVPQFIEERGGAPIADTRNRFHQEINVVTDDLVIAMAETPKMMRIVKRELSGMWGHYILFHLQKTLPFFYTSSAKIFIVGVEPFRSNAELWRMTSYPSVSSLAEKSVGDFVSLAVQLFFLIERLVWLIFFVLAFASPFVVKRKKYRVLALVNCAFIAYFALLTGPVANERYRLPAVPFVAFNIALVVAACKPPASKLD